MLRHLIDSNAITYTHFILRVSTSAYFPSIFLPGINCATGRMRRLSITVGGALTILLTCT